MKVRQLSILSGILLALTVLAGHSLFSSRIIQNGFEQIERRNIFDKLGSVETGVRQTASRLGIFLLDWSNWDDTYAFAQDANPAYIKVNLTDSLYSEQSLHGLIIRNKEGTTLYARAVDQEGNDDDALLNTLLAVTASRLPPIMGTQGAEGGIINTGGQLVIVARRPILDSNGSGPAAGSLAMASLITPHLVAQLGETLNLPLRLTPLQPGDGPLLDGGDAAPLRSVAYPGNSLAVGTSYILGLDGQPVGMIDVETDRRITEYGRTVSLYNNLIIAGAVLLMSLCSFCLLRFRILGRLEELGRQLADISNPASAMTRVKLTGNDEIGDLAGDINALLMAVESSGKALKESEERFKALHDASFGGVSIQDDGNILTCNQGLCAMTGYTGDELIGMDGQLLIAPRYREKFSRDAEPGDGRLIESVGLRRNGSTFPLRARARKIPYRGKEVLAVEIRDDSERRRSEEQLSAAHKDLSDIFAASQVGIMYMTGNRDFHRGNQRLAEILGYASAEEMRGLDSREFHTSAKSHRQFGLATFPALRKGQGMHLEWQLRRKDGAPVWCAISGKALDHAVPADLSKGIIWAIDDISARKAMELALVRAKDQAEAANKAKDEFLANISHELRTPLNGVMGILKLMESTGLDPDQARYIDMAQHSSSNLLRIINDVLDFSKLKAGRLEILEEPFAVRDMLRQCVDLFTFQADEKGVGINLNVDESVGGLYLGDESRIRQVLFNLLGNALKFTDEGSIRINVHASEHATPDKQTLTFTVEDTGIGIPEDKIGYVFESFTQVDGSFSRGHRGTGLGLPIVKRLVELMGGSIDVRSQPGIGSAFTFRVLAGTVSESMARELAALDETPTPASIPVPRMKILLVEDDQVNRLMAQRLLENEGHDVQCAQDGVQCLEILEHNAFDMIIIDIQMPRMDGIEATRLIRTAPQYAHASKIPVIALTAHAMSGDREKFIAAGMDGYLAKPIDIAKLERIMRRHAAKN